MKKRQRLAFIVAAVCTGALFLTGCAPAKPCPKLSTNSDGTYTIGTPPPSSEPGDLAGCEYEFDEQDNLTTERDTDG